MANKMSLELFQAAYPEIYWELVKKTHGETRRELLDSPEFRVEAIRRAPIRVSTPPANRQAEVSKAAGLAPAAEGSEDSKIDQAMAGALAEQKALQQTRAGGEKVIPMSRELGDSRSQEPAAGGHDENEIDQAMAGALAEQKARRPVGPTT